MKKICTYPGCPALLDRGAYCEPHAGIPKQRHRLYDKHVRQRDPALALADKTRKSARWRKIRLQILANEPLCADPLGDHARTGTTATAQQVHHILGLSTHPELAFHATNLQPLCTRCHRRVEAKVRAMAASDESPPAPPAPPQQFNPFG